MLLKNTSKMVPELVEESPTYLTNGDNENAPIGNEIQDHCFKRANPKDVQESLFCKRCCCIILESTLNTCLQSRLTEEEHGFICRTCQMDLQHNDVYGEKVENDQPLKFSKAPVQNAKRKHQAKHYCDKCRFTSKDLTQYKKHILQHEEIKFTCSYCSCVSYTKGEFQRHLVKHTGTFPYKCEYCEYGAVRNDYIVKHTKRVHGSGEEKLPTSISEKEEQNSKCLPEDRQGTLNDEQLQETSGFQKHLSISASTVPICETEFETCAAVTFCYIENDDPVESLEVDKVASCSDRCGDIHVCDDGSVEVEVSSFERETWQPGIPLTVVAPAQLVVPLNSFAQLKEVKIVNGIQKLVFKLFHQQGANSECTNDSREECGTLSVNEKMITEASVTKTKPLATSCALAETSNVHYGSNSKSDCIMNALDCHSCNSDHAKQKLHVPAQDTCEDNVLAMSDVQAPFSFSKLSLAKSDLEDGVTCDNEDPIHPQMSFTLDQAQKEDIFYERSIDVAVCSSICNSSDGQNAHSNSLEMADDPNCNTLPLSTKMAINEKCTSPIHPLSLSESSESSFSRSILHSKDINGEMSLDAYQSHVLENSLVLESDHPQSLHCISNATDGPIIVSVFSLSSGSDSFPEGICWDDLVCNMESTELPHRNVSQIVDNLEDLLEPPSGMLIENCPDASENLNRINVHTARISGKICFMDTISETVKFGMGSNHAGKCHGSSQNHMEANSNKKIRSIDALLEKGRQYDQCLATNAVQVPCSLNQNVLPVSFCKDEPSLNAGLSQSDTLFLFPKNENVADSIKKSKLDQALPSNCKQNEADCITKTHHSNFNAINIGSHLEKSTLPRFSKVMPCFTEEHSPRLVLSKNFCFPPSTSFKIKAANSQMSESPIVKENANIRQGLMYLPEEVETNFILKQNAFTSETKQDVSQEEHSTSHCTTKGEKQPQDTIVNSKSRRAQNVHMDCPLFIPKGTVLKILNSSTTDTSKESSDCSNSSVYSSHRNESVLARPVPIHNSMDQCQQMHPLSDIELFERSDCRRNLTHKHTYENKLKKHVSRYSPLLYKRSVESVSQKYIWKRPISPKNKVKNTSLKDGVINKKVRQSKQNTQNNILSGVRVRHLRLTPVLKDQLIVCPRENQPVIVLNHPHVDSLEIINIMKTVNKYKGRILQVVLSERTLNCFGVKKCQKRLTYELEDHSLVRTLNAKRETNVY